MKRSIAFVLESFFPEHNGGTERYVLGLAKSLREQQFEVSFIITSVHSGIDYTFDDFQVYRILIPAEENVGVLNGLNAPDSLTPFIGILNAIKPDIVHFHSFGRGISGFHLEAAKKQGYTTVFTTHLVGLFCVEGSLLYMNRSKCDGKARSYRCLRCYIHSVSGSRVKSLVGGLASLFVVKAGLAPSVKPSLYLVENRKNELKKLNRYADRVVMISNWNRSVYTLNGVRKLVSIPQSIPGKRKEGVKTAGSVLHILFVGRIVRIKGLHVLIDALSEGLHKQVKLTIAGIKNESERSYYEEMKACVREFDEVTWLENVGKEQLDVLYQSADILCVPSVIAEMAPLVIREAYQNNLPVIGSDLGGIPDLVDHKRNGMLFPPGNSKELKLGLQDILENRHLLDDFRDKLPDLETYEDMIAGHIGLYEELISEKKDEDTYSR